MSCNVALLESMVQEFYTSTTSRERKRDIEEKLIAFRNDSNGWKLCLEALKQSAGEAGNRMLLEPKNEIVWFFYSSTLEHVIKRRWLHLDASERSLLRETLWQIYINLTTPVKAKRQRDFYATLLGLLGHRQFPDEDPDYVKHCLSLVRTKFPLGVCLLRVTSEELVSNREDLSSDSKQYFQYRFSKYLPDIMDLLTQYLVVATCRVCGKDLHSMPGWNSFVDSTIWDALPNDDQLPLSLLELLSCLEHMVSWVPVHYISEYFFFSILELSHWRQHPPEIAVASMSVLIEILCLQKSLPYLNTLIVGINTLLEQHLHFLKQQDELYVNKFTELLRMYTRKCWIQISKEIHFTNAFLKTLYCTTVIKNNPKNFMEKLQIWEQIIYDLGKHKTHVYDDLLHQLLSETMHRLLFQYNSEELLMLGDIGSKENTNSDDDEENGFKEYVNHCIDSLSLLAVALRPEIILAEVFKNWSKPYSTLETLQASLNENNKHAFERILKSLKFMQNLRDLNTLCQVIIRILPLLEDTIITTKSSFPPTTSVCIPINDVLDAFKILNGQLLQILRVLTTEHFLSAINSQKYFASEYEKLCSQSLTTMYILLPIMMKTSYCSEISQFINDLCEILGRLYEENDLIRTISTQTIYLVGSKLLIRIATVIHPPGFLEIPTINALMCRGAFLIHLPTEVIANIYISVISYMISQQQQSSNANYAGIREYIEYLAASFLQIDTSHCTNCRDLNLSPNTVNLLSIFCLVLDYFKTSNNNTKQLLASVLKPIINKILTLYHICSKDDELPIAVGIAEFSLSVLRTLQSQLGAVYVEEIITLFINNSRSEHLNKSRVPTIEKILKMFQLIVEQPGNSSIALLPSILDFTIEQTMPLLQNDNYTDNTDITSTIYSLFDTIMKHKWQYFYKSRIQQINNIPSSENNNCTSNISYSDSGSNNLHPEHFLSIMNAYGYALVSDRDPNIVRYVLASMQYINERWRLYQRTYFRENLLSSFQRATLNILLSGEGSGSLHSDLLAETLFAMTQVDNSKMRTNLSQAVNGLPVATKVIDDICTTLDLPTFSQKLLQLVRDIHYLRLMQS